jgi:hypothetical protein
LHNEELHSVYSSLNIIYIYVCVLFFTNMISCLYCSGVNKMRIIIIQNSFTNPWLGISYIYIYIYMNTDNL